MCFYIASRQSLLAFAAPFLLGRRKHGVNSFIFHPHGESSKRIIPLKTKTAITIAAFQLRHLGLTFCSRVFFVFLFSAFSPRTGENDKERHQAAGARHQLASGRTPQAKATRRDAASPWAFAPNGLNGFHVPYDGNGFPLRGNVFYQRGAPAAEWSHGLNPSAKAGDPGFSRKSKFSASSNIGSA